MSGRVQNYATLPFPFADGETAAKPPAARANVLSLLFSSSSEPEKSYAAKRFRSSGLKPHPAAVKTPAKGDGSSLRQVA